MKSLILFVVGCLSLGSCLSKARAQVSYTKLDVDVTADTVAVFASADIPLSGTDDFYLKDFHPQKNYWAEEVYSTQTTSELCIDTSSGSPAAFGAGQSIVATGTLQWITTASGAGSSAASLDSTWNGPAHYLGVRVNKNGKWHYGWIKLQLHAAGSGFRLLGYGYDKTGDEAIKAGTGEQSVRESLMNHWNPVVRGSTLYPNIAIPNATEKFVVYDMLGHRVTTFTAVERAVSLHGLPTGVYLIVPDPRVANQPKKIMLIN